MSHVTVLQAQAKMRIGDLNGAILCGLGFALAMVKAHRHPWRRWREDSSR